MRKSEKRTTYVQMMRKKHPASLRASHKRRGEHFDGRRFLTVDLTPTTRMRYAEDEIDEDPNFTKLIFVSSSHSDRKSRKHSS
ncbi:hypothetical protein JTE90_017552 [Oedothorax gibbosus]|uniref:Uncharacterized protein n=1 Tax=Oedothorax gibbosus TaxID=931172 RepID=A0AAV6UPM4_9ARAC|nr:hypothetical protein JTE90_017552 [Oedothorax gibbosus]